MSEQIERCVCGRKAVLTGFDDRFYVRCGDLSKLVGLVRTCWTGPEYKRESTAVAAWNRGMRAMKESRRG